MQIERQQRRAHAVNLTPLIDVVFLLIVFFMLSTSFVVSESMELDVPSSASVTELPPVNSWVLRVRADGRIYSDDEDYSVRELDKEIRLRLSENPDLPLIVLASDATDVQQLVTVLDVIYINGGRKVQIDKEALE